MRTFITGPSPSDSEQAALKVLAGKAASEGDTGTVTLSTGSTSYTGKLSVDSQGNVEFCIATAKPKQASAAKAAPKKKAAPKRRR